MNKNILSVAVVAILSLGFVGCGSSSSGNTEDTSTKIEVERGKVYDATVTDSSSPVLTASITVGSNEYTFATTPTYPIKVNGGWIDVDGDGEKDTDDIELDIEMTSYSNVVTTITTYISNPSETVRQARIDQLMSDMDISSEANLLLVPSKADTNTIILANAIFKVMKENSTTDLANNFDDINSSFATFKTTFNQSGSQAESQTPAGIAKWMESKTVDLLVTSGKLNYFSQSEIDGLTSSSYKIFNIYTNSSLDMTAAESFVATNHSDLEGNKVESKLSTCSSLGFTTDVTPSNDTTGGKFYSKTSVLDGNEYCAQWASDNSGSNNYLVSSTGKK